MDKCLGRVCPIWQEEYNKIFSSSDSVFDIVFDIQQFEQNCQTDCIYNKEGAK